MADEIWSDFPEAYIILEHFADNQEEKELAEYRADEGKGMLLWGNLNHAYNQNTMGYAEESNIDWIDAGTRGWEVPHVVGYMESHDEERLGFKVNNYGVGNDSTTQYLSNRLKLVAAFNMLMPGPRMVWQFGELGYDISIDSNGRTGDKPSAWELEYDISPERKQIYNLYSYIFKLRNQYNLYDVFDFRNNDSTTEWQRTMSAFDNQNNVQVISIGNFDPNNDSATHPGYFQTGTWYKYNGDSAVDGEPFLVENVNEEFVLYKNDPVYVLSNVDIIPPVFNVDPMSISTDYCQLEFDSTFDIQIGNWAAGSTTFGSVADNSGILGLEILDINNELTSRTSLAGFQPNNGLNSIRWSAVDNSGNETIFTQEIMIERGKCHQPGLTGEPNSSEILISTLNRSFDQQTTHKNNGWLVLESKNKGLVLTKISIGESTNIIEEPVDGMLVFDENESCLKLYDGLEWSCIRQKASPIH